MSEPRNSMRFGSFAPNTPTFSVSHTSTMHPPENEGANRRTFVSEAIRVTIPGRFHDTAARERPSSGSFDSPNLAPATSSKETARKISSDG